MNPREQSAWPIECGRCHQNVLGDTWGHSSRIIDCVEKPQGSCRRCVYSVFDCKLVLVYLLIFGNKFFRACLARFKLVPVEEDGRKRKKRRMEGEREKEKRQEEEKGGSRQ